MSTSGFIWRQFVRLDATGRVEADVESGTTATEWALATIPSNLVEVTGHPQWRGLGSLIGYLRNPDGSFTAPEVMPRVIGVDAFFDLFTKAERVTMRQKARGDDTAIPPVAPDDDLADLVHQIDLKIGKGVNLDSPRMAAALTLLVNKGVLTAERRTQILANQLPA